jgi:CBS domain-containing protein
MHLTIIPDIVKDQSICSLPASSTAIEAAKAMAANHCAAVVISDEDGKLIGIVTERDLTRRVVADDRDPKSTMLRDIMSKDPDTLAPDDSALDALELMRVRGYRHLPVVDQDRVVGMVSVRDLYAAVKSALEKDIRETEAFVFGDRYGA